MTDPTEEHEQQQRFEPTGHATVDAALSELADLDNRPVDEHPEHISAALAQLQSVLDDGDQLPLGERG